MGKMLSRGFLTLALLVLLPALATADLPTWTPTGSMALARRDHTATLLPNGKVLIVGWFTTTAELYDPATGTFSATGSTLFLHGQGSTATRLLDGRVLIAGGAFPGTQAEIYDSTTGTFSATGNLNAPHSFHTATSLADGRVLIAGGNGASGNSTAVAELYVPATNTFSITGNLNTDRAGATAALLPDGLVLIAGGTQTTSPGFGQCLASAELYDPTNGTFSPTGNMSASRCSLWWSQAPVLADGNVLIVGGLILDSADLFDPAAGTFSATGNMTIPRAAPTVTLLPNGQVLVAGGVTCSSSGCPLTQNSAELYDPTSGSFTATASMATPRQQHTATLLLNGQVLVTGGFDFAIGTELTSAELFSITLPTVTPAIDIKPGSFPNSINVRSEGKIPVAILSSADLDAPSHVDQVSLTFGRTGDELSLAFCNSSPEDVNGDGLLDLVCHFNTQVAGFQAADTQAILKGRTVSGSPLIGTDSVHIVP